MQSLPRYRNKPCVDCGKVCVGKRCLKCFRIWQKSPEGRKKHSDGAQAGYVGEHGIEWRRKQSEARFAAHDRGLYGEEWRKKVSEGVYEFFATPEGEEWGRQHSRLMKTAHDRGAYKDSYSEEICQRRGEGVRVAHLRGAYEGIFTLEVRQKISESNKGEKSHLWRGGVSKEEYGPEFDRSFKLKIRARDEFRCVVCRKPEDYRAHDCHHIDYDKRHNSEDNLVTLCHSCHGKTLLERSFWQSYFEGRVYLAMGVC